MKSSYIKNNEVLESELLLYPKYSIYYREDCNEKEWFDDVIDIYDNIEHISYNKKRVLDLGAHIGLFSRIADYNGASYIYAVEPEEHNCKLLELNKTLFDNPNELFINKSSITDTENFENVILLGNSVSNTLTPSLVRKFKIKNRNLHVQNTVNLNFNDIIKEVNPDILKISIEGYEYEIMNEIFDINYLKNTNIKDIFITFSKFNKKTKALLNNYIEPIANIYKEENSLTLKNYEIIHFKKV